MALWQQKLGITYDLYSGLIVFGLIFTRVFVMLILTPFLGGRGLPGQFKMVVSIVLSTFIYLIYGEANIPLLPDDRGIIIALYFKEIFFGLALGMTTIMCFYAIEAGGRIVDSQRGSANAQIFVPQLGQVSIFGLFKFWLGLAIFLSYNGHIIFLEAFFNGFEIVPVTTLPKIAPGISPFLQLLVRMSADVLILGVQLAAPVLIAIFLTDIVLGIANKMAPQIPVFEIGFMLKGYVGVAMIWIAIVSIVTQMSKFFDVMQGNVVKIIQFFS